MCWSNDICRLNNQRIHRCSKRFKLICHMYIELRFRRMNSTSYHIIFTTLNDMQQCSIAKRMNMFIHILLDNVETMIHYQYFLVSSNLNSLLSFPTIIQQLHVVSDILSIVNLTDRSTLYINTTCKFIGCTFINITRILSI